MKISSVIRTKKYSLPSQYTWHDENADQNLKVLYTAYRIDSCVSLKLKLSRPREEKHDVTDWFVRRLETMHESYMYDSALPSRADQRDCGTQNSKKVQQAVRGSSWSEERKATQ